MTEQSQETEQLRMEIARTRADMDRTLAALEDRVSPSRIKDRQTEKVRSRFHDARDRVMGTSNGEEGLSGARDRMSGTAHDAQEAAHQVPERIESATQGNPLAAGLIAFGVGALMGSLLPPSEAEKQIASELRDEFEEPMREGFREAAQRSKDELQEHAQQAMEETKETAQDAMHRTQSDVQQRGQELGQQAQDTARSVREERESQPQSGRRP